MNVERLLGRWIALACAMLLFIASPSPAQEKKSADSDSAKVEDAGDDDAFGGSRKPEPKSKTSKRKRPSKADDAKSEKPTDDKPSDEPAADKSADDEGSDFGGARNKSKVKKIDEAELAGDKNKARFVKQVKKQFREKNAYYVLATLERGYEEDKSAPAERQGPEAYKPYERIGFEVLTGQDEAVAFVVEYVSKYGAPWEKKPKGSSSRKSKDEAPAELTPPKPIRDWKIEGMFETSDEAEGFRTQRQNAYENEKLAAEEQRKLLGQ